MPRHSPPQSEGVARGGSLFGNCCFQYGNFARVCQYCSQGKTMFLQIVSVVGAIMVLGAYLAHQTGKMGREDRLYSLLNFVGAALLAWVATIDQRWGFIA